MITIQNQNFGVEIELTGISRQAAAQVIADYYGTIGTRFMGTVYKTYEAVDNKGRRWKCMRDASITPQRRVNGHVVDANDEYKCEVVTPILQYEDIPDAVAMAVVDNRTIYIFGNAATVWANYFLHKGHAPFKYQCPTRGPLAGRRLSDGSFPNCSWRWCAYTGCSCNSGFRPFRGW